MPTVCIKTIVTPIRAYPPDFLVRSLLGELQKNLNLVDMRSTRERVSFVLPPYIRKLFVYGLVLGLSDDQWRKHAGQ